MYFIRKYKLGISMFFILNMTLELFLPSLLRAQAATGPSAPDFIGLTSTGTTGASVNEYTGKFGYSIPILTVPGAQGEGYSMSLNYNGPGPDEEASWVGYGWSLTPGAITRAKRGFPDEFDGVDVIRIDKQPETSITTVSFPAGIELWGTDVKKKGEPIGELGLSGGLSPNIHFSDQNGISTSIGGNLSLGTSFPGRVNGAMNVGVNIKNTGETSFNASIYPTFNLRKKYKNAELAEMFNRFQGSSEAPFKFSLQMQPMGIPDPISKYSNSGVSFECKVQGDIFGNSGLDMGMRYSRHTTKIKQKNEVYTQPAFGYLFSASGWKVGNAKMDFNVDYKNSLDELDSHLPIPIVLNDEFNVTANGLNGNFRAYATKAGHYKDPIHKEGPKADPSVGLEINAGGATPSIGIGADVCVFTSSLKRDSFVLKTEDNNWTNTTFTYSDEYYFGFTGENSQSSLFYDGDLESLKYEKLNFNNCSKRIQCEIVPIISSEMGGLTANMKDGHVGKKDYPWLDAATAGFKNKSVKEDFRVISPTHIKAFTKADNLKEYKKACNSETQNLRYDDDVSLSSITEYEITSTNGSRYTFGLPVYAKNETNLTFSLRDNHKDLDDIEETSINRGKRLAFYEIPDIAHLLADNEIDRNDNGDPENDKFRKFSHVRGEVIKEPYTTNHLLTSIESDDYIDIDNDGPTPDDLGRYVKFEYTKWFGGNSVLGWFNYRQPFNGLNYSEGTLADRRDDMGSFSAGEKEVYYLDEIKTKTHLARFISTQRKDGYMVEDPYQASHLEEGFLREDFGLKKLDKIELYEIDHSEEEKDVLIQTIHFKYDYSLCSNYPGNKDGEGKLTLLKVWTENHGVKNELTKPIEFVYEYPNVGDFPSAVTDEYLEIINDFPTTDSDGQNPDYDIVEVNKWGIPAPPGSQKEWHDWEDQNYFRASTTADTYDPAAYQLKQIIKPGGSKTLIQYERDRYRYLQNSIAGVMAPLHSESDDGEGEYSLDLGEIGVTGLDDLAFPSTDNPLTKGEQLATEYTNYFRCNKVYFNFLYRLEGDDEPDLTPMDKSQYIDGYAAVESVEYEGGKIKLNLVKDGYSYSLPHKVCKNYAKVNNIFVGLEGGNVTAHNPYGLHNLAESATLNIISENSTFFQELKTKTCIEISLKHSYFRIPLPKNYDKFGGGIRVKRLLSLDNGIEDGDDMLFGTEYFYENKEGSSGVASNEPELGGNENMLIKPFPRGVYNDPFKILAGKDKEKLEGFVQKSFLPSPSIGYSKVIKQSIAKGKSANGFVTTDYFTHRTHPVIVAATELNLKDKINAATNLGKSVSPIKYYEYLATQGYMVLKGDYPGKVQTTTSYTGKYDDPVVSPVYTKKVENFYSSALDKTNLMTDFEETSDYLGLKDELYFYGSDKRAVDMSFMLGVDATFTWLPATPIIVANPNAFPWATHVKKAHKTHTTVHVVTAPSFLTKVQTSGTGQKSFVETTTYDPITGNPLISSTSDGFTGLTFNDGVSEVNHQKTINAYTMPAYNYYEELGGKYINDGVVLKPDEGVYKGVSTEINPTGVSTAGLPTAKLRVTPKVCGFLKNFYPGDLIRVGTDFIYHITEIDHDFIFLEKANYDGFIDETLIDPEIEIIRSGRKNMLDVPAGGVSYYNESGQPDAEYEVQSEIDDLLAELNAGIPAYGSSSTITLSREYVGVKHGIKSCLNLNDFDEVFIDFSADPGSISFKSNTVSVDYSPEGKFIMHRGNIAWDYVNECGPITIIELCPLKRKMENVVAANANTLSDVWEKTDLPGNAYVSGNNGRWRTDTSFVYSQDADKINEVTHTTKAGILKEFELFPFGNHVAAEEWINTSVATKYDNNSNLLESKNALDIHSSTAYGYNEMLPIFNTANSELESCLFESFEMLYEIDKDEDGFPEYYLDCNLEENITFTYLDIEDDKAHSGRKALKLHSTNNLTLRKMNLKPSDDQMELKMWVKQTGPNIDNIEDRFSFQLADVSGLIKTSASESVAKTGEWTLLKSSIEVDGFNFSDKITPTIKYNRDVDEETEIYLDDIRIAPAKSAMTCYIYDPGELKILSILNDNHFATFYQYNFKGELIRKRVETMKGVKTLSEQYSHLKDLEILEVEE